jgi:hypothetical protein
MTFGNTGVLIYTVKLIKRKATSLHSRVAIFADAALKSPALVLLLLLLLPKTTVVGDRRRKKLRPRSTDKLQSGEQL